MFTNSVVRHQNVVRCSHCILETKPDCLLQLTQPAGSLGTIKIPLPESTTLRRWTERHRRWSLSGNLLCIQFRRLSPGRRFTVPRARKKSNGKSFIRTANVINYNRKFVLEMQNVPWWKIGLLLQICVQGRCGATMHVWWMVSVHCRTFKVSFIRCLLNTANCVPGNMMWMRKYRVWSAVLTTVEQ